MPFGAPIPPSPRGLVGPAGEPSRSAASSWHPTGWSAPSTPTGASRSPPRATTSRSTCSSACRSTARRRSSSTPGLCVDGWIPVDPGTLETAYPGVYAVGDVTSVGTPKAGVFAERQAAVVAEEIIARANGGRAEPYDGRGICYIEFGAGQVAKVDVSFLPGQSPPATSTPRARR